MGFTTELHTLIGGDRSACALCHVLVPVLQRNDVDEVPIYVWVMLQSGK